MTYNEICLELAEAGIENDRGEAAMLICQFCNINKAELLQRRDENFDSPELEQAVLQRRSHFPLQYIFPSPIHPSKKEKEQNTQEQSN